MYKVLYICHDPHRLAGSPLSLANLISALGEEVEATVLLSEDGVVADYFRKRGISVLIHRFENNVRHPKRWVHWLHYWPKRLRNSIYNKECISYCARKLHHADIVHTNTSVIDMGVDMAHRLGAKHVWHLREYQNLDFRLTPFRGWKRLLAQIQAADGVIAITQAIYNHWHLEKSSRALVLWDAVRKTSDVCLIPRKEPFFFFCSAIISPAKSCETSIRAFALTGLAEQGYKLKIAGKFEDENYRREILSLISQNRLDDNVEFLGYVSDIKPVLSRATAFLMTSQNEAQGRVTIEAMFYGCPVIARNTGGHTEFVLHEETGLLFDTDRECADRMTAVTQTMPVKMIKQAQEYAVGHFSEECYKQKLLQFYNTVLNEK